MTQDGPAWPPIITGAALPARVVLRDVVITLVLWVAFAAVLVANLDIAWQAVRLLSGEAVANIDPMLEPFLARMQRRLLIAAVLVSALAVASVASLRGALHALRRSPPLPASDADLARALGLSVEQLGSARQQRVLTIVTDDAGRVVRSEGPSA